VYVFVVLKKDQLGGWVLLSDMTKTYTFMESSKYGGGTDAVTRTPEARNRVAVTDKPSYIRKVTVK